MKNLDFGGWHVAVSLHADHCGLAAFLDRAAIDCSAATADLTLEVVDGAAPRLLVDMDDRRAMLTVARTRLADRSAEPIIVIAVLQAAARCLALVNSAECSLLHGGAVVLRGGRAIAVLDGGRGQGKTSIALALGQRGGHLLADEFLLAREVDGSVVTGPARRLPWHVREDMTPYLLPGRAGARLGFPDDFSPPIATARKPVVLDAVLFPDTSVPAGSVRPVPPTAVAALLWPALCDHRAKLLDPTLDHVSLFESATDICTLDGTPLALAAGHSHGAAERVHELLAQLPVYLVGIGAPSDIMESATAALRILEAP